MPNDDVVEVPRERMAEVVELLSLAFHDYPVMRHVVGAADPDYEVRLRRLVGLFTETRYLSGGLVLAVETADGLVAAANIDRPRLDGSPQELEALRRKVWRELGDAARERYADYGAVSDGFEWPEPRFHLGMLGVLPSHAGRGYARPLLDALHRVGEASEACGCSLTTENPANLSLYEHFGYRVIGHGVQGGLEGWGLFRTFDG